MSDAAFEVITGYLQRNPQERLGCVPVHSASASYVGADLLVLRQSAANRSSLVALVVLT